MPEAELEAVGEEPGPVFAERRFDGPEALGGAAAALFGGPRREPRRESGADVDDLAGRRLARLAELGGEPVVAREPGPGGGCRLQRGAARPARSARPARPGKSLAAGGGVLTWSE